MLSMSSTNTNESTSLLSTTDALKLISTFFPKEWARTNASDIHISKITGGLINTLQHIRRTNASTLEPPSVLIRQFGLEGNFKEPQGTSIDLSAAQQAVVCWEMNRRGWGPQIYGFFPGERLEEFIEGSHTLTAAESTKDFVQRDVARAYERLHSLQLPLRKDSFATVVRELSGSAVRKREGILRTLSEVEDSSGVVAEFIDVFGSTD
jgi:choline/ethanolamine kinase